MMEEEDGCLMTAGILEVVNRRLEMSSSSSATSAWALHTMFQIAQGTLSEDYVY